MAGRCCGLILSAMTGIAERDIMWGCFKNPSRQVVSALPISLRLPVAGGVACKMRLFAIGDIHGCYAALVTLSAKVGFGAQDVVVVLGDYVDRGPDSRLVLDTDRLGAARHACAAARQPRTHDAPRPRGWLHLEDWISAGGSATSTRIERKIQRAFPHGTGGF